MMSRDVQVEDKLVEIFKIRTSFDLNDCIDYWEESFFGSELSFTTREVALAFLDIRDEFGVMIPRYFMNGRGCITFRRVLNKVKSEL
ncbi:hypothetical protein JZO70_07715 [Enterococcus sp. 669A]|uniref:Uncharacterized protein n=1 Tax=Candidatus Enterococcus moelleringii TaxID=2815325 RepID=A0ABS3L8U0_9ENTE|nr:hypothetical protein [Enterococcus sp. 669A]MBO1306043.1 hypothetical protein [Enterococcus sp. 669A]